MAITTIWRSTNCILITCEDSLSLSKNHIVDSYPNLFSKINISLRHTYPKVCVNLENYTLYLPLIYIRRIRLFKNVKKCLHNLYKMENNRYNLDITVCIATIVQGWKCD
jgi:hypothetical protein